MSVTLSCLPMDRALVDRMAALSTREYPVTIIDSGVEHAPGAVSWALSPTAPTATSASVYEAIFRITQIYTSQFGGGPADGSLRIRQKGRRRVALRRPFLQEVWRYALAAL